MRTADVRDLRTFAPAVRDERQFDYLGMVARRWVPANSAIGSDLQADRKAWAAWTHDLVHRYVITSWGAPIYWVTQSGLKVLPDVAWPHPRQHDHRSFIRQAVTRVPVDGQRTVRTDRA